MQFVFHAIVEWKYVNRTRIASLLISHLVCCGMVLYLTVGYWGGGGLRMRLTCLQLLYIRVGVALSHVTSNVYVQLMLCHDHM